MKKYPLIRKIYLYLFALIGLILLTIGSVRFLDMGLKTFIFTKADEEQQIYRTQPLPIDYQTKEVKEIQDKKGLTDEERNAIKQWIKEYKTWKEKLSKFDYIAAKRQRDASLNLSLIFVGLPLYLYHWAVIKRETKEEENDGKRV